MDAGDKHRGNLVNCGRRAGTQSLVGPWSGWGKGADNPSRFTGTLKLLELDDVVERVPAGMGDERVGEDEADEAGQEADCDDEADERGPQ